MKNLSLSFVFFLFFSQHPLAQPFWEQNFAGGLPADWAVADLSGQGVDWGFATDPELISDPDIASTIENFNSSSVENGFMLVRSAEVTTPHVSTLTTNFIDCSTQDKVYLSFESFVLTNFISAAEGVRVLVKNEEDDWESFQVMPEQTRENAQQQTPNPYRSFIDISSAAANFSEVQIRWEWEGIFEEFWALDDIALFDTQPYYERVVWGNHPGEGDFTGGIGSWYESVIDAPQPSRHRWEWQPIGSIEKALVSGFIGVAEDYPYLDSYSNHTGAMVFNADFYTTGGVTGVPPPYPSYHTELISPPIDLRSIQNEVNVRFEQLFMKAGSQSIRNPSTTSFTFTTDGGRTWATPIGLNTRVRDNALVQNTQTISICEAAGHGNVRLKFIFEGDLYFWAIDDVVIIEKEKNDVRIRDDFFAIAPNVMTPASQTETIRFMADVENFGENNLTNVELMVEVTEKASGQSVFKDTLIYGDIKQCDIIENVLFNKGFLPPTNIAEYNVKYLIQSDSIDGREEDNELQWSFEIGDTTYAKETGATTSIEPTFGHNFEYGNVFFVPRGTNHEATSITFGIDDTDFLQNASVNIFLYRSFADINEDGFIDQGEFEIVGFNEYTFRGDEESLSGGMITAPLFDFNLDSDLKPVPLEDNVYYFATIQYVDDDGRPCKMLASQDYDYLATWFVFDSLSSNRYAGIENTDKGFDLESLQFGIVPVIRLNINEVSTSTQKVLAEPFFSLYPNPTADFFSIKTEIPGLEVVELFNEAGVKLKKWNYKKHAEYQISEIPAGTYFLKFKTKKAFFSRKLVKLPK